jgi:hypothetical protein
MNRLILTAVLGLALGYAASAQHPQRTPQEKARIKARALRDTASKVTFPAVKADVSEGTAPGVLSVDAVARLNQLLNPEKSVYFWRLEVLKERVDPGPPLRARHDVVWSQDYDERELYVPAHADVNRPFHERLNMPAGRYLVRLSALEAKWEFLATGPELVST